MSRMDALLDPFTGRELEILHLLAEGLSDKEIAGQLFLTPGTIKWYNQQLYIKLGVTSRTQAVAQAKRQGLLEREAGEPLHPTPPTPRIEFPAQMTSFIGRKREIMEVKQLLQNTRLLTLTGVGGTGKTRLGLRVASEVRGSFADGVYFVDLAPVNDTERVTNAIAAVLGVIENPTEPQLDTLKRALAGRELLLMLDNFEHIIEAAPLVADLLAASPRLKALVTSREALRLSGEQEYPVPPLSLPPTGNPEMLAESEAAALFVQRVLMILPHFEVTGDNAPAIAQICARLDGLPLAIELAAARCKLLSPQALLSRLDSRLTTLTGGSRDAPLRQQTLRQTIEWSYNLLEVGEKTLFARLAVFRGGRSLGAIEAICGKDLPMDVLDGLASLVNKSLIEQKVTPDGEPRFVMLETLHEYAWERLEASGEAETMRRQHAEYFVELAERAEPELRLSQQARWFQLLEVELNNLRAVLEWSLGEGDAALGLRLAGALYLFWWAYGYHVEGYHWTQQLLERLDETSATSHAKFLFSAGGIASLHDIDAAKRLLMSALDISRRVGDKPFTGWTLTYLFLAMQREPEAAMAFAEEGLALFRELDHKPGIAQALNSVGLVATIMGEYDRAERAFEEGLTICRQTGDYRLICPVHQNLAYLALHQGDHERAWDAAQQALYFAQKMSNRLLIIISLPGVAGSLGLSGNPQRAVRLMGASEAALEGMGALHQPSDIPEVDRIIALVRAQLDEATFEAAWAEGRRMTLEQALEDR